MYAKQASTVEFYASSFEKLILHVCMRFVARTKQEQQSNGIYNDIY